MSESVSDTASAATSIDTEPPPTRTMPWLSLAIPHDWLWKESTTLLAPDGSANVIASSEPLDAAITLEEYVQAQGDLLSTEFQDFHQYKLEGVRITGGVEDAVLRDFAWNPPDGQRVRQLQVYAVRQSRGITATGTTPESEWGRNGAQLLETILSLLVDPR
jgi:hypothetical protein